VCVLCRDGLRWAEVYIRWHGTNLNGHGMRNSLLDLAVREKKQSGRLYSTVEFAAAAVATETIGPRLAK
jgi:hypothetical protein